MSPSIVRLRTPAEANIYRNLPKREVLVTKKIAPDLGGGISKFGSTLVNTDAVAAKAVSSLPLEFMLPIGVGMAAGGYFGLKNSLKGRDSQNPDRYFWTPNSISETKRGLVRGGAAGLATSIAYKAMTSDKFKNFFNKYRIPYYATLALAPVAGYFGAGMLMGKNNSSKTMVPEGYLNSDPRLRSYYDNSLQSLNTLGRYSRRREE